MSEIRISRRAVLFLVGFLGTLFVAWYGGVNFSERGPDQAFSVFLALMFGGFGVVSGELT